METWLLHALTLEAVAHKQRARAVFRELGDDASWLEAAQSRTMSLG